MAMPNHPITLELCQAFVAMHEAKGSLLAAAKLLGDTNFNLSRRIQTIVEGPKQKLPRAWLRKDGKRFELTAEGERMLNHAKDFVERWELLVRLNGMVREAGLSVACGQEAAGGIVLKAAAAFRADFPGENLTVAVTRGRQRIEGVASGRYDLALVTTNKHDAEVIAKRRLVVHELGDDELMLACAVRSPWSEEFKKADDAMLAELLLWPLILPETDSAVRQEFDKNLRKLSPKLPTIAMEVGGWRVLQGYVQAGFGVGLLPRSVLADAGNKLRSRSLPEKLRPKNRSRIVTLPRPANAELVAAFVKRLQNS